MIRWTLAYLGAGLAMIGLDSVWLSLAGRLLYRPTLDPVLLPQGEFRLVPAIVFYLVYLLGVVIFAIRPALQRGGVQAAAIFGGLYGLFCYATYDLTNQATLAAWSTRITLLDIAWGVTMTALAACVGFLSARPARPKS